jgi:protein-disulfide isomerase
MPGRRVAIDRLLDPRIVDGSLFASARNVGRRGVIQAGMRSPCWLVLALAISACGAGRHTDPSLPRNRAEPQPPIALVPSRTLTADQQARVAKLATSVASPCGKAHSLRTSLDADPSCKRAPHAMRYLERLVADDVNDGDVDSYYRDRYGQTQLHTFDVSRAPLVGNANAACRLVVFVDYQCPHCAMFATVLTELEARYRDRISVHHKHFPLSKNHVYAFDAAVAAAAADRQGKFLPMHQIMLANQPALSAADIEAYAQQVGLDLPAFQRDIASPELHALVEADRAEADRAGVDHVPAIYINGRTYSDRVDLTGMEEWIDEQLDVETN